MYTTFHRKDAQSPAQTLEFGSPVTYQTKHKKDGILAMSRCFGMSIAERLSVLGDGLFVGDLVRPNSPKGGLYHTILAPLRPTPSNRVAFRNSSPSQHLVKSRKRHVRGPPICHEVATKSSSQLQQGITLVDQTGDHP